MAADEADEPQAAAALKTLPAAPSPESIFIGSPSSTPGDPSGSAQAAASSGPYPASQFRNSNDDGRDTEHEEDEDDDQDEPDDERDQDYKQGGRRSSHSSSVSVGRAGASDSYLSDSASLPAGNSNKRRSSTPSAAPFNMDLEYAKQWIVDALRKAGQSSAITREDVYDLYSLDAKLAGYEGINKSMFGRIIHSSVEGIGVRRLGPRKESKYHYIGVEWRDLTNDQVEQRLRGTTLAGSAAAKSRSGGSAGSSASDFFKPERKMPISHPEQQPDSHPATPTPLPKPVGQLATHPPYPPLMRQLSESQLLSQSFGVSSSQVHGQNKPVISVMMPSSAEASAFAQPNFSLRRPTDHPLFHNMVEQQLSPKTGSTRFSNMPIPPPLDFSQKMLPPQPSPMEPSPMLNGGRLTESAFSFEDSTNPAMPLQKSSSLTSSGFEYQHSDMGAGGFMDAYMDHWSVVHGMFHGLHLQQIPSAIQTFWQSRPADQRIALCERSLIDWIVQYDQSQLLVVRRKMPLSVINIVPQDTVEQLTLLSAGLLETTRSSLETYSAVLMTSKIRCLKVFVSFLKRFINLNQVLEPAMTALSNHALVETVRKEIAHMDLEAFNERARWVCQCFDNDVSDIVQNDIRMLLQSHATVVQWWSWINSLLNRYVNHMTDTESVTQFGRLFISWVVYIGQLFVRDMAGRVTTPVRDGVQAIVDYLGEVAFDAIEHRIHEPGRPSLPAQAISAPGTEARNLLALSQPCMVLTHPGSIGAQAGLGLSQIQEPDASMQQPRQPRMVRPSGLGVMGTYLAPSHMVRAASAPSLPHLTPDWISLSHSSLLTLLPSSTATQTHAGQAAAQVTQLDQQHDDPPGPSPGMAVHAMLPSHTESGLHSSSTRLLLDPDTFGVSGQD
ncbi:hypothetical protein BC831DRAFT_505216 [Entophlyctis helioformis]|nr:hypothetical protein BC831DRAFT_505216 [Entophlyctis helioformis]